MSMPNLENASIVKYNRGVVRKLIAKLGGPTMIAAWCGDNLTGNAVTAWGLRDKIPWRWKATIKAMAEEKQVALSAKEQVVLSLK
jgi:hypothetical protein